jgi:type IV pilus assembly protein PilA
MKKNLENKKGFTLIELIIVIAIIGILAAIAVPKFGNIQLDSKRKADFANAKVIADATMLAIGNNVTFTDATKPTADEIKTYLAQYPKPQLISGEFKITVKDDSVTVMSVLTGAQKIEGEGYADKLEFQLYPVLATKVAPYDK